MIRLRAGISYALTEAMDEGHCGLPTDQLIPLSEELLEAPPTGRSGPPPQPQPPAPAGPKNRLEPSQLASNQKASRLNLTRAALGMPLDSVNPDRALVDERAGAKAKSPAQGDLRGAKIRALGFE
jgi:hypothetical protein